MVLYSPRKSKKFLEKINAKGVVVRVDPVAKLKEISMTCLVVSSEPLEKGWERAFFNLEDNLLDSRTTNEQTGLVDVHEFFVWAVTMSLTHEEIEFISSLQLKQKASWRIG